MKKVALCSFALAAAVAFAQTPELAQDPNAVKATPGKVANSDVLYKQLRAATLSSETTGANNLALKRDAATFTFHSGTFYWLQPVNGRVTGAVFIGNGSLKMVPPTNADKRSLSLLTKEPALNEEFNSLVLRFSDGTYEEVKKAGGVSSGAPGNAAGELDWSNSVLRERRLVGYNLHGRLLDDVIAKRDGGVFYAFIRGKKYNDKELFAIDPRGVGYFAPEEVMFMTWDDNKFGYWATFHLADEYRNNKATGTQQNLAIDIVTHKIDVQIEKSAKLTGDTLTTFVAQEDGLHVIPLDLFPTLRVSAVTGKGGEALDFIQEDKDKDANFFVILSKPLKKGEEYAIRTQYSGKEAVSNEGGGNYYPIARDNWYPNTDFSDAANYEITFRVPKGMTIVGAAGKRVKEVTEGSWVISEWASEKPQTVSGFNLGEMKVEKKKIEGMDFEVESYANANTPDWLRPLEQEQTVSTTGMMKKALAEGELSVRLFTDYFGPLPFKRVAMTQQTAPTYGQAWPGLVYLPLTSYLDSTTRYKVAGFDPRGYFRSVAAHEVAHQWWGHMVTFKSFRDQWMSEGFSELSASLYIQMIQKNNKEFKAFWDDQLELMTETNRWGFRAIDVGPVTLAYRLNNTRTGGDITRRLIYPKGGYILHMIRMMMWDHKTGDDRFKAAMREFATSYNGKAASTEDFKATIEKHMTDSMDLDGNRRMDWFFDQYVYGTALPSYKLEQSIDASNNLNFKITQSGVTPSFKMMVPLYLELQDGRVIRLGNAAITGNTTYEQKVPLGNTKVKRAMLAYYNDVLGLFEKK